MLLAAGHHSCGSANAPWSQRTGTSGRRASRAGSRFGLERLCARDRMGRCSLGDGINATALAFLLAWNLSDQEKVTERKQRGRGAADGGGEVRHGEAWSRILEGLRTSREAARLGMLMRKH